MPRGQNANELPGSKTQTKLGVKLCPKKPPQPALSADELRIMCRLSSGGEVKLMVPLRAEVALQRL